MSIFSVKTRHMKIIRTFTYLENRSDYLCYMNIRLSKKLRYPFVV